MPDYTVSLTARQNLILIETVAAYNTSKQNEEGFIALTVPQFVMFLVTQELQQRARDIDSRYEQVLQLLKSLPEESRSQVIDLLPQRLRVYIDARAKD